MKSKELRIGNYVYGYENQMVEGVNATEIRDFDNGKIKFEPIPLTEEWLLKFGFSSEESEAGEDGALQLGSFNDQGINFLWVPKIGRYMDKDSVGMWVYRDFGRLQFKIDIDRVKYCHQLQNLYFHLTGEELTIK